MKKLLLTVMVALAITAQARAESLNISESLSKLPEINQGFAYSIADSKFNYLATVTLFSWKGLNFEGGYAGRAKDTRDKIITLVSYDLINLKKLGVTTPFLDLIDVNAGYYIGYGSINVHEIDRSEFDHGIALTAIKVKF